MPPLAPRPHPLALLLGLALTSPAALAQAPHVQRMDVTPSGQVANERAGLTVISTDGSTVVFASKAGDLVSPPLTEGTWRLFAHDRRTGLTEWVSVGSSGQPLAVQDPTTPAWTPYAAVSGDGRYVAFESATNDAGLGVVNPGADLYLRDRQTGTTELISTGPGGPVPAGNALQPSISDDGRYVSFVGNGVHWAPIPVPAFPAAQHFYRHDRQTGLNELVDHADVDPLLNEYVVAGVLSADGTHAGLLYATGLDFSSVSLRVADLTTGTDHEFGLVESVTLFNERSTVAIDGDGSTVAFGSQLDGLLPGDSDGDFDVFAIDVATGTWSAVNRPTGQAQSVGVAKRPSLSPDGRYVAFESSGAALAPGSTHDDPQVYVHDLATGLTTLASLNDQATAGAGPGSGAALLRTPRVLSDAGRFLVYESNYANLPKHSGPGQYGIYAYDRHTDGPELTGSNLVSGGTATLTVTGATPGGMVLLAMSVTGQGPFPTYWGPIDLSPPFLARHVPADASGTASVSFQLAPALAGAPLFARGIDLVSYRTTTTFYGPIL